MGDLSAHFSTSELWCHHCHVLVIAPGLLDHLEALRRSLGGPLYILSGYRCPDYNRMVGGALHSRHLAGAAVDFSQYHVTPEQAHRAGFVGVGVAPGRNGQPWAVHADLRPGPPLTFLDT